MALLCEYRGLHTRARVCVCTGRYSGQGNNVACTIVSKETVEYLLFLCSNEMLHQAQVELHGHV